MHPLEWQRGIVLCALLASMAMMIAPLEAQPVLNPPLLLHTASCMPDGAMASEIRAIGHDGVFVLSGGISIRLDGLLWPDVTETKARQALRQTIETALKGTEISWKPVGVPDRWGRVPAHLFVNEPGSTAPPFWLQAGLVEKGHAPLWPGLARGSCWSALRQSENEAIKARRGVWAPRLQEFHRQTIATDPLRQEGRRFVMLWVPKSIRAGRALTFVNMTPSNRHGATLLLTRAQKDRLTKSGKNPDQWLKKRLIARFVLPYGGLSRIRIETVDHVDLLP
jgi:hypothetical protein